MKLETRKKIYAELKIVGGIEEAFYEAKIGREYYRQVMTKYDQHPRAIEFSEIALLIIDAKRDAQNKKWENLLSNLKTQRNES